MDVGLLALFLGLGSAVTLASANAFVKASGDILMSRAVLSLSGAVMIAPAAFFVPLPTPETWALLALSVPAHMAYQTALIRAMHRGDLSLVFPVMRGSAPLLTAVAAFLFLGENLSWLAVAGLVVASLATMVFAIPENAGAETDPKRRRAALGWALLTGAGIALYNVVDARGVRAAPSPFTFIVWMFILDSAGVNLAAIWTRRSKYLDGLRTKWRYGATAAAFSIVSYSMALYGFSVAPVAYVSALRETSVVFAAILGLWMLKEGFGSRRVAAASVLAGGLIMIQLG